MIDPHKFTMLLNLYQHRLTKEQQLDLFRRLKATPDEANRAMEKYMASAPSGWFDWGHLVGLLRREIMISLGLPSPEQIWGYIGEMLIKNPPDRPIAWPNVVKETVTALGGHMALRASENEVSDRARAQATYDAILNQYLTDYLGNLWEQSQM